MKLLQIYVKYAQYFFPYSILLFFLDIFVKKKEKEKEKGSNKLKLLQMQGWYSQESRSKYFMSSYRSSNFWHLIKICEIVMQENWDEKCFTVLKILFSYLILLIWYFCKEKKKGKEEREWKQSKTEPCSFRYFQSYWLDFFFFY